MQSDDADLIKNWISALNTHKPSIILPHLTKVATLHEVSAVTVSSYGSFRLHGKSNLTNWVSSEPVLLRLVDMHPVQTVTLV